MIILFIFAITVLIWSSYGALNALVFTICGLMFVIVLDRYEIQKQNVPDQVDLLDKITSTKIDYRSEKVIGTYKDNKIHEFILVNHPEKPDTYLRYDFEEPIPFNGQGQITRKPNDDEVFLMSGLIYKNTGVEMTIQKK
jgi:hypothetical protein